MAELLDVRRARRLSDYVKLALAATAMAVKQTPLPDAARHDHAIGAILGTTHGSATFSGDYYRQIVEEGLDAANPLLFAEGVPNVGAAHLSMMLGLKGGCQSVIGSRTAGLDALYLASQRIAAGEWDAAIVNAADEYTPLIHRAYRHCGLYDGPEAGSQGFVCGAGSVSVILESVDSAQQRGVTPLAVIDRGAQCTWPVDDPAESVDRVAEALESLGPADDVAISANATWIDRVEAMAVRKAFGRAMRPTAIYGRIAETFSVMPLASIVAWLLNERHVSASDAKNLQHSLAVLVSDYNGVSSAMGLRRFGR